MKKKSIFESIWANHATSTDYVVAADVPNAGISNIGNYLATAGAFGNGNYLAHLSSAEGNTGIDMAAPVAVADTVEIPGASAQPVTFTGTAGAPELQDAFFTGNISGLTGPHGLDLAVVVDPAAPITVADGATVEIPEGSGQPVTFTGTTGTLKLDDALAFTGKISGLTGADALDLVDVSYGVNTTATFSGSVNGGTLTIADGTHAANIALLGDYLKSGWTLSSDGHGGTVVVDPPLEISPNSMAGPNSTVTMNGSTFSVGVQEAFSNLAPVSSLAHVAGVSIGNGQVTISADNLNLAGINFQGWNVVVQANNVTLNNCLFDNSGYYALWQKDGYNGLTVENSSFIGDKTADGNLDFLFSQGVANVHNNVFINASCSAVWVVGGTVAENYIGGGGYDPTAHADGIYQAYSTAPLTIQQNYINWNTPPDAAVGSNNAIVLISEGGPISNTSITSNVILGGGYTLLIRTSSFSGTDLPVSASVTNNQIGDWGYGPLNFGSQSGGSMVPTLAWSGNTDSNNGLSVTTTGDGSGTPPPPAAPAVPTITKFSPDTGVVGDHITDANTLTLTGTAVANSTVKVFDGTTQVAATTADSSGGWTVATTKLADGSHSLTATDTVSGTTSVASAALSVTIDTVAPNPPVETSASIVSGTTKVQLTGTAAANSSLQVFDGTTQIGTATANSSGAWSLTTGTLASGSHSLTTKATDAAGNTSLASAALAVTIPSVPTAPAAPTIVKISPDAGVVGDGITDANTLTLTGTAVANSTVKVFDGSTQVGTTAADSSGSWSYITSVLTDAIHVLTATDTVSGVTSAASSPLSVTVDTVAPAAPVLISDPVVNTNHVLLSGTAEANSTITVYDGTTAVGTTTTGANGTWSVTTVALAGGAQALTATATDVAGNVSGVSQPLDPVISSAPTPPAAPQISTFSTDSGIVGDHITNDNTPMLTGTAASNSAVNVFDGTTQVGTTTANSSGQWHLTTKVLSDGPHNLSATDTDSAGHISASSATFSVTVDTHAPGAPTMAVYSQGGSAVGNTTTLNDLVLKGTAEANSTIDVFDSGKQIGTTSTSGSGTWSFDTGHIANGSHSFTATAIDVAGNISAASPAKAETVTAPATPTTPIEFTGVAYSPSNHTATIKGTADAYGQIKLYDGTLLLGTVTASANGTWSLTNSHLSNTLHTIKAQEFDSTGHAVETSSGAVILAASNTSTLKGTGGDDFLFSSSSNLNDTFVFAPNFGHSTIEGFTVTGPGQDTVQFSKSVFDSFASVLAHATQVGQDVVISADASDSVTIKNTKLSALNSHDFHFA